MNKYFDTIWTNLQATKARETSYAVTVDSLGFVYVGGYTLGDLNGDVNKGGSDGFVAKYSADGTLIWSHLLGNSGGDAVSGISSDKYNNVYVFVGLDSRYEPDPVPAAGVSAKKHKLIKFDSTGSELASISVSTQPLNASGLMWFDLVGRGISVNSEGDVFVTGSDGMWHQTYGAYFSKEFIDSNGDASKGLTWENKNWFPSAANSFNTSVFSNNSVFAAGRANGDQAFITKYSVNSTVDWTRTITSSSYGEINAMAADSAGGLYVVGIAGEIKGAGYTPGRIVINAESPPTQLELDQNGVASADAFIAKFDSNGNQLWVKQFGTEGDDSANSVAVDIFGNIYVGGFSGRTYGNTAVTNTDARPFVKVFDSVGNISWSKTFDDANGDTYAMSADDKGFIYAAGMTQGDLNGVTSESNSGRNGFLMKLAYLTGSSSNDSLEGSSGNDEIYALAGNDTVVAGAGNDVIIGSAGLDSLNGGTGADTVDYSDQTKSITADLRLAGSTTVKVNGKNDDILTSIENLVGGLANDVFYAANNGSSLTGGGGNDSLFGNTSADVLYGGDGNDAIKAGLGNDLIIAGDGAGDDFYDGGDGIDTAQYTSALSGIRVDLSTVIGIASSRSPNDASKTGTDRLIGIENITAGDFDDQLIGSTLANVLSGGAGEDFLNGGAAADTLNGGSGRDVIVGGAGNDAINGGGDIDTADFSDKTTGVVIVLIAGAGTAIIGSETDSLASIENLSGGLGNDALAGDNNNNQLVGKGGIDTLKGGAGIDSLDGGTGSDTADFSDKTTDVVISLNGTSQVTANVGNTADDKLVNIENLIGGSANDTFAGDTQINVLRGGSGNDSLKGGAGADVLDGGPGSDTADYSDKTATVVITLNGAVKVIAKVGTFTEDSLSNIENLIGGSASDNLKGDSFNNKLSGGMGRDSLTGGSGRDQFVFNTALNGSTNLDTVTDFVSGTDTLALDAAIFSQLAGGVTTANIVAGTTAELGSYSFGANHYLKFDTLTKTLFYDATGYGSSDAVAFVQLTGLGTLAQSDILIF
jgi:Ca2+-binding RTX toxin-like protein